MKKRTQPQTDVARKDFDQDFKTIIDFAALHFPDAARTTIPTGGLDSRIECLFWRYDLRAEVTLYLLKILDRYYIACAAKPGATDDAGKPLDFSGLFTEHLHVYFDHRSELQDRTWYSSGDADDIIDRMRLVKRLLAGKRGMGSYNIPYRDLQEHRLRIWKIILLYAAWAALIAPFFILDSGPIINTVIVSVVFLSLSGVILKNLEAKKELPFLFTEKPLRPVFFAGPAWPVAFFMAFLLLMLFEHNGLI